MGDISTAECRKLGKSTVRLNDDLRGTTDQSSCRCQLLAYEANSVMQASTIKINDFSTGALL